MKHRLPRFLRNKWLIGGLIAVVIIVLIFLRRGGSKPGLETTVAAIGNVVEKVSVTGKVLPVGKADLSFQKGGVLMVMPVKVGDHVSKGQLIASLDSRTDQAALASVRAQLADITRGLRPEEFAVDQSAVLTASTSLVNARKDAVNAVRDAYVKAQSAVVNYADQFFNNPQGVNPSINIRVQSQSLQLSVNDERLKAGEALSHWKADIDASPSADSASDLLGRVDGYMNTIKNFMGDLSAIINDLSPGNSGLTQTAINTYAASINTGQSTLTQAATAVTNAETGLKSAQSGYVEANNQFTLKKAGSSAENIQSQAAKVAQAQAELAKDMIFSPIDGIITRADPNVGEYVSAGQAAFAVQSDNAYKIEARVAEADIAKVAVNDSATVTLDAYGSDVDFPATVSSIDPAETVLEGVPTYKVTLLFATPDPRIRSGMTANTDILTHEKDGVLVVPTRAVTDTNGVKAVRILRPDGKTFYTSTVTTGLKGSDGTIEIVSGLKAGDKVVTYVK